MSDKEKVGWLLVLVWCWAVLWFAFSLIALVPGARVDRLPELMWVLIPGTLLYLLILSWRLAYIGGSKR